MAPVAPPTLVRREEGEPEGLSELEARVAAKWGAAALTRTPPVEVLSELFDIHTWLAGQEPVYPPAQFPRQVWANHPSTRRVALMVCDRLLDNAEELTDEQWATLCVAMQYAGRERIS